ncbi:SymE family type I addiction module toxin [Enterobacter asburiae]|uniref:SymE family type I addiction module toxin n=1 Tax=unclassified Scandinavium TaxID=2830652 RepID=UPI00289C1B75|nr:SymE family type I addiction module toxin [Scandinavium sp.]
MNPPVTLIKEEAKSARRIKVGYVRKRHQDPKTGRTRRYSLHPSLVLSGNWLKEAGFPTGACVSVTIKHGQLILQSEQKPVHTLD